MKRFNFRLERLLNIKKYKEEEAKLKYAETLQKKIMLENENKMLKEMIYNSLSNEYPSVKPGDTINFNTLNQTEKYITNAQIKIKINNNKKKIIEKELDDLKIKLDKAVKERKIIDQLKSKKYEKYKKDIKKEEIKYIDEIAGQMKTNK